MNNAGREILQSIQAFVQGSLPLENFQEQIALAHWDVETSAPALATLVYQAVGKLAEYSRGHRDEKSLRDELATALRIFHPDVPRGMQPVTARS